MDTDKIIQDLNRRFAAPLISNPAMRKQVKNYRAYFNAKDRRLKVSTQNKVPETPPPPAW